MKHKTGKSTLGDRPPAFTYKGNAPRKSSLHCESFPLTKLADKFGTPLYVYSGSTIRDRFTVFDHAFKSIPHTVCYSVKANSNLSILKLLARLGSGFDVVSGGELERVLLADKRAAKKVVFSGVGKTADEMDAALHAGILMFNVESESELWILAERAATLNKTARVALRVNPDVSAKTHPYIATGLHKHKFGIPVSEATTLYKRAAGNHYLDVAGVSAHIGSQIMDVSSFAEAMKRLTEIVCELRSDGIPIRYVDAGGGLGIRYDSADPSGERDFAARISAYAKAIMRPLDSLNLHLLLEPGRIIAGPSGVLLTRILYIKNNNGKRFIVVDGGMNDLIRPSLYGAHHDVIPVVPLAKTPKNRLRNTDGPSPCDVVGPICETGDFFARDRVLPPLSEGDLLAILDAGAYGMSLSSNYNSRTRPAEVLVEGSSVRTIRKRESISDLVKNEL